MTNLDDLRATTHQTLVTLHHVNGLPMPCDTRTQCVRSAGKDLRTVFLTFDTVADLDRWAEHFGLSEGEWFDGERQRVYSTSRFAWPEVFWCGWHSVRLYAFEPLPELVAAAALTPDSSMLPGVGV